MPLVPLRTDVAHQHRRLADALAAAVRGEVRFDPGTRALYATDASNYRHVPIGVVTPRDAEDVIAALEVCREHDVPVLSRGGGTSLAGQCCNVAVVLDFSRHMRRVIAIDRERRTVRVQPGCVLDDLRAAVGAHGLTFAPDPATHDRCTIGGMLGNNSCGVHSVMGELHGLGPRTEDNVRTLDVLTYDGTRMRVGPTDAAERQRVAAAGGPRAEIHARLQALVDRHSHAIRTRFPAIPRRVSGYDLPALLPENGFDLARALVGTESTCVTILEAELALVPAMAHRALLTIGYDDVIAAARAVPELRTLLPIGLEGIDEELIRDLRARHLHEGDLELLPAGDAWLLVEFGADSDEEVADLAERARGTVARGVRADRLRLHLDRDVQQRIWEIREAGLAATAFVPGRRDAWPGWEDSAVPPDRLPEYLERLRALFERHGYHGSMYGHFGQGCVHCRIDFDLGTRHGVDRYAAFTREAADLVVSLGGSLSGEHGDGQARADLLERMYGREVVGAFREFKAIWDPRGRMNPGKVVDPHPRTADLRLGPEVELAEPTVRFRYHEDDGSFAHASVRCVGVGACRRSHGGTMCPSYRAVHEERHVTRGRAHLLHEMLRGEVITHGWQSQEVYDALDLCLSCKGCSSECPVHVDIPVYKAEFLAHYHAERRRPRQALAFGMVRRWLELGARVPRLANLASRTPGLRGIAKWVSGTAPQREIPAIAHETFVRWFRRRPPRDPGAGPRVLLWPDTFNDHLFPAVLIAATEVLEHAGYVVALPAGLPLCCGRPLYEYGLLDRAVAGWKAVLDALGSDGDDTPIVGIEPSCVAAFRDELVKLMGRDPRAAPLSQRVVTLGQQLARTEGWTPPRMSSTAAIVQRHCQQQATVGYADEIAILRRMGIDCDVLDEGCCGMAGAFGFTRGRKYEVSMQIAEHGVLARARAAPSAAIIADGFSCREQFTHGCGRRPLHLAEVIHRAIAAMGEERGRHG